MGRTVGFSLEGDFLPDDERTFFIEPMNNAFGVEALAEQVFLVGEYEGFQLGAARETEAADAASRSPAGP